MKSANPTLKKSLGKSLLSWYGREKRALPWRQTNAPYRIWISEIMLQQTQVVTVIPYYHRWLKVFPTIYSLARAPIAKVLKLWEGLGYYRRARMLHKTAKIVVKSFGGKIPSTTEELLKLPGIGRYSAGAIASIAFNKRVPILDGNVIRILTRIFAIRRSIDLSSTIKQLWETAASLLPDHSTGDFNQSLMELGATVCFPQNPNCDRCPVQWLCKAHKQGKEMMFPFRSRNDGYEKISMYALVAETKGKKIFVQRQPLGHWWAGLWTFPFWNTLTELKTAAKSLRNFSSLGVINHGVTRFRIQLRVFVGYFENGTSLSNNGRWVRLPELSRLALPSPHRKIATLLLRRRLPLKADS